MSVARIARYPLVTAEVDRSRIVLPKGQPRKSFPEASLHELARNIRKLGVLSLLFVRPLPGGMFELMAGERRLRACDLIEERILPVRIFDVTPAVARQIAMIENIVRQDLDLVEEIQELLRILEEEEGMTPALIADRFDKSLTWAMSRLAMADLSPNLMPRLSENAGEERVPLGVMERVVKFQRREQERVLKRIIAAGGKVTHADKVVEQLARSEPGKFRLGQLPRQPSELAIITALIRALRPVTEAMTMVTPSVLAEFRANGGRENGDVAERLRGFARRATEIADGMVKSS